MYLSDGSSTLSYVRSLSSKLKVNVAGGTSFSKEMPALTLHSHLINSTILGFYLVALLFSFNKSGHSVD